MVSVKGGLFSNNIPACTNKFPDSYNNPEKSSSEAVSQKPEVEPASFSRIVRHNPQTNNQVNIIKYCPEILLDYFNFNKFINGAKVNIYQDQSGAYIPPNLMQTLLQELAQDQNRVFRPEYQILLKSGLIWEMSNDGKGNEILSSFCFNCKLNWNSRLVKEGLAVGITAKTLSHEQKHAQFENVPAVREKVENYFGSLSASQKLASFICLSALGYEVPSSLEKSPDYDLMAEFYARDSINWKNLLTRSPMYANNKIENASRLANVLLSQDYPNSQVRHELISRTNIHTQSGDRQLLIYRFNVFEKSRSVAGGGREFYFAVTTNQNNTGPALTEQEINNGIFSRKNNFDFEDYKISIYKNKMLGTSRVSVTPH